MMTNVVWASIFFLVTMSLAIILLLVVYVYIRLRRRYGDYQPIIPALEERPGQHGQQEEGGHELARVHDGDQGRRPADERRNEQRDEQG